MTRRRKLWQAAWALFSLLNVGGAIFAFGRGGEPLHVGAHVVLALVGAFVFWRLGRPAASQDAGARLIDERLDQLQQSVDAVALEVERIGEAQRFAAKIAARQGDARPEDARPGKQD